MNPPLLRVGLVTGEYPPQQGGVGDFTRQLGLALAELGHEVHVLTRAPGRNIESEAQDGLRVHRQVADWGWTCWKTLRDTALALHVDVLNLQIQPAAYDLRGPIYLFPWVQRRMGCSVPVVTTFHDLRVPYLFPKAGPLRPWAVRFLAQTSDAVIAVQEADRARLAATCPVPLIPIGSNILPAPVDNRDRDAWRAHLGADSADFLLGFFGFLNERKGVDTLLEAMAHLVSEDRRVRLAFIGGETGDSDPTNRAYAGQVRAQVRALNLDSLVAWTGYLDPAGVSASLRAVDACVLPFCDGASLHHGSLHACLAHGRPVITTATSPLVQGLSRQQPAGAVVDVPPALVDGENVCLIPAGDAPALAAAIAALMEDPTLRQRLSTGASELARQFSWKEIARRTAMVYARVCGGAG